jgi:hypothetical protein
LGLVRDGGGIDFDDDIDIMVPYHQSKKLESILDVLPSSLISYNLEVDINTTPYFKQYLISINEKKIPVDFYFYDDDEDYIIDWWTHDAWLYGIEPFKVPKALIFPLKEIYLRNNYFNIPAHPEACCLYLFGRKWRMKKRKNIDYETFLKNGHLFTRKVSFKSKLIKFLRRIHSKIIG